MFKTFNDYFKFPENIPFDFRIKGNLQEGKGFFLFENSSVCYGSTTENISLLDFLNGNIKNLENINLYTNLEKKEVRIPFDLDEVINNLRNEKYIDNSIQNSLQNIPKTIIRTAYYALRPIMPISIRKHLQKFSTRNWKDIVFPKWPLDTTVEEIFYSALKKILIANPGMELPFIWFWPKGKIACSIITHDVEEEVGKAFIKNIIQLEKEYDIKSSFQLVPEVRYKIEPGLVDYIKDEGHEVCLHGLNHDGNLFSSKKIFQERIKKILEYAQRFGAIGFRSPVMYRNLDWYNQLGFKYDMSVPNNANIDPQRGGCCTVLPYYIDNVLELPLTTLQDHPLYYYFNDYSIKVWQNQAAEIIKYSGLVSFIIHPDYTISEESFNNYKRLLAYIKKLRDEENVWTPLPCEVYEWWNKRNKMELKFENGNYLITGEGSEDARIAYMKLKDGELQFNFA